MVISAPWQIADAKRIKSRKTACWVVHNLLLFSGLGRLRQVLANWFPKHRFLLQPYKLTGKRHHLYGGTRPENLIDSSGPRQRSRLLQPKFEHSSSGETYLLPPSAGSGSGGAEAATGRRTDGCPSSSTGNGANN